MWKLKHKSGITYCNKRILILLLLFYFFSGIGYSQNRHWVFAVQKDLLSTVVEDLKFDQTFAGAIKHDIGFSNNNYISLGLGMYQFNTDVLFEGFDYPLLNIRSENDFPLSDYLNFTDGRVGIHQFSSREQIEYDLYLFLTYGRDWLHARPNWGFFTDIGLGINYDYYKGYFYNEVSRFPYEEFNDTYFEYYGYSIIRGFWFSFNLNLDLTYYLTSKFGVGINVYVRRPIGDDGLPSAAGFHIRYTY